MSAKNGKQSKAQSYKFRKIIKSPFDELRESLINYDIVDLCIKSITGQELNEIVFRSRLDEDIQIVSINSKHLTDKDEKNKYNDIVIAESWCTINLGFRLIEKEFTSYHSEIKDKDDNFIEKSYFLDEPYLDHPLQCKTPGKCSKSSCENCKTLPCKGYDEDIERMVRTILTTHSDVPVINGKNLTPISIFIPTSLPKTKMGVKSKTKWKHVIVEKDVKFDHLNYEEKLSLTHRILLVFQALRITSLKSGRSVDQRIFFEIMSSHKLLIETLSLKRAHKSLEICINPEFVKRRKKEVSEKKDKNVSRQKNEVKDEKDQLILGNFFGNHKVEFNSLRVTPWRENDKVAITRDIDVLSTGLTSLMTYCSATVITFYVEGGKENEHPSPYIIAPKNIINMFLDLRENGFRYHENFNLNKTDLIKQANFKNNNDRSISEPELDLFISNRRNDHASRKQHEIYPSPVTYKSLSAENKNKIHLISEVKPKITDISEANINRETMKTVKDMTKKRTVKISEMRTSLGFRVCSIDQDHFDPEEYDFRKLSDDPDKYLKINFPIAFRYNPDKT